MLSRDPAGHMYGQAHGPVPLPLDADDLHRSKAKQQPPGRKNLVKSSGSRSAATQCRTRTQHKASERYLAGRWSLSTARWIISKQNSATTLNLPGSP